MSPRGATRKTAPWVEDAGTKAGGSLGHSKGAPSVSFFILQVALIIQHLLWILGLFFYFCATRYWNLGGLCMKSLDCLGSTDIYVFNPHPQICFYFILLFYFWEEGREKPRCERETSIGSLPHPSWLGMEPPARVCALTRTGNPGILGMELLAFQGQTHLIV